MSKLQRLVDHLAIGFQIPGGPNVSSFLDLSKLLNDVMMSQISPKLSVISDTNGFKGVTPRRTIFPLHGMLLSLEAPMFTTFVFL